LSSEQEYSGEQARQMAIARRRMSRQQLADKAKLSLSTLEKVLGGRRPLTLATAVRVEEALGVSLRRGTADSEGASKDGVAPDGLGAYSRRGAAWLQGVYVTIRPSFGDKGASYAYRTEILWDEATSRLVFREAERVSAYLFAAHVRNGSQVFKEIGLPWTFLASTVFPRPPSSATIRRNC
jgi:transcriptional regulator with XRE-family HTH domain